MKTITIMLPDSAICGVLTYVNIGEEIGELCMLRISEIEDGKKYAPNYLTGLPEVGKGKKQ